MQEVNKLGTWSSQKNAGANPSPPAYPQNGTQLPAGMAYGRMLDGSRADFIYLYANPAFHALVGADELAGRQCADVTPQLLEPGLNVVSLFERVANSGEADSAEVHFAAAKRWYRLSAFRPQAQHFVACFDDITATKMAEQRNTQDADTLGRLLDIGALVLQSGTRDKIFGKVIRTAMAITRADFGNIQLLDRKTGDLHIVAHRGRFPQWWLDYWDKVAAGHGTWGTALATGQRMIVEDVEHSPAFAGTAALDVQLRAGIRALQSTPVVTRFGEQIGMLSVHFRQVHKPDELELLWLDLLASFLADLFAYLSLSDRLALNDGVMDSLYRTKVARELNIDLLKKQVNGLCRELGRPPVYPNGFPPDMSTLFDYYLGEMR